MRSSGQTILEENLRVVPLDYGNLQVSEILTESNSGNLALVWVWYGNSKDSSGSFYIFGEPIHKLGIAHLTK